METKLYRCIYNIFQPLRSYPTYEEWKLKYSFKVVFQKIYVLILPMRNGNIFSASSKPLKYIVLILPMRNGNPGCDFQRRIIFSGRSYPTYEEWKLDRNGALMPNNFSSYPTYEEWKRYNSTRTDASGVTFLSYL